jgi:hypothetical protein
MKKAILGLVAVIVVLVVGVVAAAMMQPDKIHLERQITIADATAADMAPFAEDLKKVNEWSPWVGMDPNAAMTYSEKTSGVGASYSWKGNDQVGEGKMEVTTSEPGKVVHHLTFVAPFEGQADATIAYEEKDGGVVVTWSYDDPAPIFMTKVMSVFMSMESMLGPEYEKGLQSLKPLVEAAAAARVAAEKAAAEKAAAEKAAAEKAAAEKAAAEKAAAEKAAAEAAAAAAAAEAEAAASK